MLVALERFDLRIPGCGSLKEKRHVVKTLTSGDPLDVQRLGGRGRSPRAVAAHGDRRGRGRAASGTTLRKVLHEVERFVERWGEVEVIDRELTLHYPEDVTAMPEGSPAEPSRRRSSARSSRRRSPS